MTGMTDQYGAPAADGDLDPTHLRAIGERMKAFADVLDLVRKAGENRDVTLAEIKQDVKKLEGEVDGILRLKAQFTDEQVKNIEDILLGRDRGQWLRGRVKTVALYLSAMVGFLATLNTLGLLEPLKRVLR